MSVTTVKLLKEFEALPVAEKQLFVKEIFRRLPPYDSGRLDDEVMARAGDDLAASLEEEENDSKTR